MDTNDQAPAKSLRRVGRVERLLMESEAWMVKARLAQHSGRERWAAIYRKRAELCRRELEEAKATDTWKNKVYDSGKASAADSAVLITQSLRAADMPRAEGGPCIKRFDFSKVQYAHMILGYAATQAAPTLNGFFFEKSGEAKDVFVVSDRGVNEQTQADAATWILNHAPSYTEALRAVKLVRWLPILIPELRSRISTLLLREREIADSDSVTDRAIFIVWSAGAARQLVTEEFAEQLGTEVFGFAARLKPERIT